MQGQGEGQGQGQGRDDDLMSFREFCNTASNLQADLDFADDVLAIAQGNQLQNDVSLGNRNMTRNQNIYFLNPNPNQSPSVLHLNPSQNLSLLIPNPNQNSFLWIPYQNQNHSFLIPNSLQNPSFFLPNPNQNPFILNQNPNQDQIFFILNPNPNQNRYHWGEQYIIVVNCPGYQIHYMARQSLHPGTNVTSTFRVETDISRSSRRREDVYIRSPAGMIMNHPSYSGIGNSASQPMLQNWEIFVRNSRWRLDLGQGMLNMVVASLITSQSNMHFPIHSRDPHQPMNSSARTFNTHSIPLARPILNHGQLMYYHTPASNNYAILRPQMYFSQRANVQITQANARTLAPESHKVASHSQQRVNQNISTELPTSHHQRAQTGAVQVQPRHIQRASFRRRNTASSGDSQTALLSQTGNRGTMVEQERRNFLPPPRIRIPRCELEGRAFNFRGRMQSSLSGVMEILDENELRQIDRFHDMRLDIDHMSYEELVALGDRIGYKEKGVSEKIINKHMRQGPFAASSESDSKRCSICQEEFVEGVQVVTLDCGHIFHSNCIKNWLVRKNTCPNCNATAIRTESSLRK